MSISKSELVTRLIHDDINTIQSGEADWFIDGILREGFVGYRNQTRRELEAEYKERGL